MWGRDLGQLAPPAGRDDDHPDQRGHAGAEEVGRVAKGDGRPHRRRDGVAYVPDWGGYLTAVDTRDGSIVWQRPVTDYVVFGGVVSRTSPAVVGGDLVLGFTTNRSNNPLGSPAVANGVMYAASMSGSGDNFYALDTATAGSCGGSRRGRRASPARPSSTASSTGGPATTGSTWGRPGVRSSTPSRSAGGKSWGPRPKPWVCTARCVALP